MANLSRWNDQFQTAPGSALAGGVRTAYTCRARDRFQKCLIGRLSPAAGQAKTVAMTSQLKHQPPSPAPASIPARSTRHVRPCRRDRPRAAARRPAGDRHRRPSRQGADVHRRRAHRHAAARGRAAARPRAATVEVVTFAGLTVDAARDAGASVIFRGLRDATDFDYEMQMCGMNGAMAPAIGTVFLPASPGVRHITATLVRQIAQMGGDVIEVRLGRCRQAACRPRRRNRAVPAATGGDHVQSRVYDRASGLDRCPFSQHRFTPPAPTTSRNSMPARRSTSSSASRRAASTRRSP